MNPDPANTQNARKAGWLRRRPVIMALALVLITGAVYTVRAISRGKESGGTQLLEGQYFTAKRGPLVISLLAGGQVKAKQVTEIKCMVYGDLKITWLIDEGTFVKPGEKLAELESSVLQESAIKQQIQVAQAQAEYEQSIQNYENQKSKNYSDIIIAQNKFDMAVLDLEKYIKGDYQQKLREAESEIKLSEAELKRANERLDGTKKLLAKGYVNRGELEADTLAQTKCQIELDKAKNAKELLEKYEYKRETSSLETAKQGAEEELKRTKKEAESELANKKTLMDSAKASLELEKYQLARYERQLKNTVIYAPQGGMVVYAKNEWDDESSRIRLGGSVHYQQRIIDLPDFSSWRVEARVHESVIQEVKVGQKASINVDAFPGQPLTGEVERISLLPDSNRWAMDTKEYIVYLAVTTTTLPLKPGMTAKTEVLMDSLKDVIYVPVQAISTVDGKSLVYVRTETVPRAQEVAVGQSNDRYAEIKSGLREGDQVILMAENTVTAGGEKENGEKKSDGEKKDEAKDGEKSKDAKGDASGAAKTQTADSSAKAAAPAQAVQQPAGATTHTLTALGVSGTTGGGKS